MAFLGSSSYGVCDDVNGLVNYYKAKEQKEEQNAISFVDELDEQSFIQKYYLEYCELYCYLVVFFT